MRRSSGVSGFLGVMVVALWLVVVSLLKRPVVRCAYPDSVVGQAAAADGAR